MQESAHIRSSTAREAAHVSLSYAIALCFNVCVVQLAPESYGCIPGTQHLARGKWAHAQLIGQDR